MSLKLYVRDPKNPQYVQGPFNAGQLRQLVRNGALRRGHQVSIDQVKWVSSTKVKPPLFAEETEKPPSRKSRIEEADAGGQASTIAEKRLQGVPEDVKGPQAVPAYRTPEFFAMIGGLSFLCTSAVQSLFSTFPSSF